MLCTRQGNMKKTQMRHPSTYNNPLLYTASEYGQLDIVRSLIDHSSDDNEKYDVHATALDAASKYGHLEVAKLLIERGVDVDSQSRDGWTRSLQRRDMDSLKSRGYCLT